jgi:hypothetical protein
MPKLTYTPNPLYMRPQPTPASLCRPISPSHHQLTLQDPRGHPLLSSRGEKGGNPSFAMQWRGALRRRSGPSPTPISICMLSWRPSGPNPALYLDPGTPECGPRQASVSADPICNDPGFYQILGVNFSFLYCLKWLKFHRDLKTFKSIWKLY